VQWDTLVSETDRIVCADAQTSGGLLLAVAETSAAELQRQLKAAFDQYWAVEIANEGFPQRI
jgi:selenophosphate synthase